MHWCNSALSTLGDKGLTPESHDPILYLSACLLVCVCYLMTLYSNETPRYSLRTDLCVYSTFNKEERIVYLESVSGGFLSISPTDSRESRGSRRISDGQLTPPRDRSTWVTEELRVPASTPTAQLWRLREINQHASTFSPRPLIREPAAHG